MTEEPNWYTCDECGNRVNDGKTCPCSQPIKPDLDDLVLCDMNETRGKPDYDYFRTQMGIILTNMDNYTKDELRRVFIRLSEAV